MKKSLLLTGVLMVMASAVLAGPPKEKPKKPAEKTKIACAVMKDHEVNIKEATTKKMYKDYKGKRYFFCCAGCPGAFDKDPAKFASAPSIPTPKEKGKAKGKGKA